MKLRASSRGFTLFELLLSLGVLGAASAIFVPLLMASAQQRRLALQDELALLHLSNQLEILTLLPHDDIPEGDVDLSLDSELSDHLPGVRRRVVLTPGEEAADGFRVVVTLTWADREGRKERAVSLAGWNLSQGSRQP